MKKLYYNILKELLILLRDPAGLAILFLMPLLLIILITLTQDDAIRSVNGGQIKMLLVDHDQGAFGSLIKDGLSGNNDLKLVWKIDGEPLTDDQLKSLISKGEYKAGIIVSKNSTQEAKAKILDQIQAIVESAETKGDPDINPGVRIYFDPAIKDVVKRSLTSAVKMAAQGAESGLMINVLFSELSEVIETEDTVSLSILNALKEIKPDAMPKQVIQISVSYSGSESAHIKPTVTQNNVPAFSLFAMFFIVIPLAGSLIAEKNEGTYDRIMTLPVSYLNILSGKTVAYLIVCFLQFILMVFVGVIIFPLLLGLPGLEIGNQYFAIFMATIASALSAIGFGLLVGTFSSSHNQAAMFGAILVVMMAALGGIFMPVHMMPENLKIISNLSPLRWGVESYLQIFVRGAGISVIWKQIALLVMFFIVSVTISTIRFGKKTR